MFMTIYAVLERKIDKQKVERQHAAIVCGSFVVSFIARLRSSTIETNLILANTVELFNQLIFIKINSELPVMIFTVGMNFALAIIDPKMNLTYYKLFSAITLIQPW